MTSFHTLTHTHKKGIAKLTNNMQIYKWINYADCHNLYFLFFWKKKNFCHFLVFKPLTLLLIFKTNICLPMPCLPARVREQHLSQHEWMQHTFLCLKLNLCLEHYFFTPTFYIKFPETKNHCYRPLCIWQNSPIHTFLCSKRTETDVDWWPILRASYFTAADAY
jgi:hypothetical protein